MNGWTIMCPICWRTMLPTDGLLSELMPRLAWHLWDEHDAEAAFLKLHLTRPPAAWPVFDEVAA